MLVLWEHLRTFASILLFYTEETEAKVWKENCPMLCSDSQPWSLSDTLCLFSLRHRPSTTPCLILSLQSAFDSCVSSQGQILLSPLYKLGN